MATQPTPKPREGSRRHCSSPAPAAFSTPKMCLGRSTHRPATATMSKAALFVLLLLFALRAAAASGDARHLLDAKAQLSDPAGALAGWDARSARALCRWPHVSCAGALTAAVAGLALSDLSLAGGFPAALCELLSLERLDLSANDLTGPLPACLAALPALAELNLVSNNFSGQVPPAYGAGFRSLRLLNLVANCLSGPFPGFLANLPSLQELLLAYNDFSPSPLPDNLGDLAALRVIFVAGCNLNGTIPASVGKLRSLVNLDLSNNALSGEIPASIANLSSVEQIELFGNRLSGRVPQGLGGLKKLRRLDLSTNRLAGEIPPDLFAAPSVESVHLSENNLTGRLPATLATARRLADLRAFANQLEGPLPPEFGKNSPLGLVDVTGNTMSGPIPATLCASGKLRELMLLNNQFDGAIPAELGQCRTLERVRLNNNRLSGPVPPEFWGLPDVYLLELRDNALSGTVDPAIGRAGNLSMLLIEDNRFTGALPDSLGNLAKLEELLASNNIFSGPLPPSIGDLSLLYRLDLRNNSFSGEIPRDIGRLNKLTGLHLQHNHFTGSIPPGLADIHGMNALDLSSNELSGAVPAQLHNLKLSEFNLSYNKLAGPLPLCFNDLAYRNSFLGNPGLCYGGFCPDDPARRARLQMVISILTVAAVILLAWFTYRYRTHKKLAGGEKASWVLTSFHTVEFSEEDILDSLDESNVIGEGAGGKVYKATVGPKGEAMAVKKLWAAGAASTFEAEVATLSRIRHKNIVKLFGSLTNRACRLLVYEYMPKGSLGGLLHSAKAGVLDWPTRYRIAVHAAEGLCYLHHDCAPPIVHRDVKSNNILLDDDLGAKVADFGVAKTIGATMSVVAGSCGYIAPEYAYTLHVTEKSDVYSFGVVILELVTGKSPTAPDIDDKDLVVWVSENVVQNGAESVLDQRLADQCKDEMCKVLNIAMLCVNNLPTNRPPMRSVVNMLLEVSGENKTKAAKKAHPAI